MSVTWSSVTVALLCVGCDDTIGHDSSNSELICEIDGIEDTLSTTSDELKGKKGDDWFKFTKMEPVTELSENATIDEVVDFYANEENFVHIP